VGFKYVKEKINLKQIEVDQFVYFWGGTYMVLDFNIKEEQFKKK